MSDSKPYQVLARKYRPAAFAEVVGQAAVVSTLCNAITSNRLHHAYLFSGTRGVGKTTLARLFARALNCVKGPTTEPCGQCDPCTEIAAGSSMDVMEIDGASNRKVEDVDPLREAARYAPARDRHKIFLIDEVHMLSETAFNALLKILEEPPPRTVFLFATTEPEQVPDTILSRCLHLACRRVPRQEIAGALAATAASEKVTGTREAFDLIAGLASGSMRDGLSLLDQVIAFSGGDVTPERVREALGLIDRGLTREFVERIGHADAAGVLGVVERLSEAGADLTHFSREALSRVRDVMIVKAAGAKAALALGLSQEEATDCDALAGLFSQDGLLRLAQAMLDLADRMRREEHPRFLLEASSLRMIRLADLTPVEDLIKRLDAGGGPPVRPGGGGRTVPAAGKPAGGATAPSASPSARRAAGRAEASEPRATRGPAAERPSGRSREAARLLERIAARRVSLATFLEQARRIELASGEAVITIQEKQGFVKTALEAEENLALIREEASAVAGAPVVVRILLEEPPADDLAQLAGDDPGEPEQDATRKRDRLMAEALKEPVVRTVMDLFKGKVVDIREGG